MVPHPILWASKPSRSADKPFGQNPSQYELLSSFVDPRAFWLTDHKGPASVPAPKPSTTLTPSFFPPTYLIDPAKHQQRPSPSPNINDDDCRAPLPQRSGIIDQEFFLQSERVWADKDIQTTTATSIPDASSYDYFTGSRRAEPSLQFPKYRYKLPSLDISQVQAAQAGQYWPGATASTPSLPFHPTNTLPTPPTTESDVFKPPAESRDHGFDMAAAAAHQHSSMSSSMEPSGPPQSLTARRSAASHLPNFELPPPPAISQKFMTYTTLPTTQSTPSMVSVGNLLTPPSNIPGDSLSPISSSMSNGGNSNQNMQSYTPGGGFWPSSAGGNSSYTLGTGTTPQAWNQGSINPLFPPRGIFSPSLNSLVRNSSNSPSSADGLPPPPFDMNQLPPFPGSMSMSAPSSLPSVTAQQQQQHHHHHQHHHQALAQAYMNAQSPGSAAPSQTSPVNASDSFAQRPPPTPSYYNGSQPSSTPQSGQFPAYQNPSPVQQSPMSASTPHRSQISPISTHTPGAQQGSSFGRSYAPYSLPAMPGPIMTNMHSPGGQMAMVGMPNHGLPGNIMPGFNSGSSAQLQQMYGAHQPTPHHNERPFKCDQCPQSFNRNHDLKRHKRIHLAVKPFPCGHCEKSFSRKDALKVSALALGMTSIFKHKY
ncbi:MAG: hypothetical protein LQ343_000752 [Gyalolechia ehrenbergii]|nr:MAG: hypothetical protein LQ343_000752 [Gyalolechia ehrenbergii]